MYSVVVKKENLDTTCSIDEFCDVALNGFDYVHCPPLNTGRRHGDRRVKVGGWLLIAVLKLAEPANRGRATSDLHQSEISTMNTIQGR